LSFESACATALNWELAEKDVKGQTMNQFAVRQKSNNFQKNRSRAKSVEKRNDKCTRCGGSHECQEKCPVINWNCRICGKIGHIAKYCFSSKNKYNKCRSQSLHAMKKNKFDHKSYRSSDSVSSERNSVHELSEELKQMQCYVESKIEDRINAVKKSGSPLLVTVMVQNNQVEMEVDSGACASLISEDMYLKMFSYVPLIDVVLNFVSVTGDKVKLLGKLLVNVRLCNGVESKSVQLELFVIKSKKPCVPLLGRAWLVRLYPSWRNVLQINQVSQSNNILESLAVKYPNVTLKLSNQVIKNYKAEIVLKDNVKPIFHKAYTVPFKLREKVNVEIDRLVSEGILEQVK